MTFITFVTSRIGFKTKLRSYHVILIPVVDVILQINSISPWNIIISKWALLWQLYLPSLPTIKQINIIVKKEAMPWANVSIIVIVIWINRHYQFTFPYSVVYWNCCNLKEINFFFLFLNKYGNLFNEVCLTMMRFCWNDYNRIL